MQAISKHLGPAFKEPFKFVSVNFGLLQYSADWLSEQSAQLIQQIYTRDFEMFAYSAEVPPGVGKLSEDAVALAMRGIKLLRGRYERIDRMLRGKNEMESFHIGPATGQGGKNTATPSGFGS